MEQETAEETTEDREDAQFQGHDRQREDEAQHDRHEVGGKYPVDHREAAHQPAGERCQREAGESGDRPHLPRACRSARSARLARVPRAQPAGRAAMAPRPARSQTRTGSPPVSPAARSAGQEESRPAQLAKVALETPSASSACSEPSRSKGRTSASQGTHVATRRAESGYRLCYRTRSNRASPHIFCRTD